MLSAYVRLPHGKYWDTQQEEHHYCDQYNTLYHPPVHVVLSLSRDICCTALDRLYIITVWRPVVQRPWAKGIKSFIQMKGQGRSDVMHIFQCYHLKYLQLCRNRASVPLSLYLALSLSVSACIVSCCLYKPYATNLFVTGKGDNVITKTCVN